MITLPAHSLHQTTRSNTWREGYYRDCWHPYLSALSLPTLVFFLFFKDRCLIAASHGHTV